jgi:hypothetical protein
MNGDRATFAAYANAIPAKTGGGKRGGLSVLILILFFFLFCPAGDEEKEND